MTTTNDWLQQGIAAARAGQRAQARQLLVRAIQADQYNEEAWVWLAGVVDDPAHARQCLQQALRINPLNPQARQGIAWLDQQARQASTASVSVSAPMDGQQLSTPLSSNPTHAASVQAASQTQQASSEHNQGLFQLPPATNDSLLASQSNPSAQPAFTSGFRLPGNSASAQGKTSAKEPARRFSLFGKHKPADGAGASDAAAAEAASKPARHFSLFGKSKLSADAATPGNTSATEAAPKPARRFSFFDKPNPAVAPIAAAAATAAVASATGAAMPAAAPAAAPAAQLHRNEKVLPPEEGDPTRDCCPYCGELNRPDRKRCRRCNRSLMIRGPAREKRSLWLSILGIVWILGGVLGILVAIAILIGALVLYSSIMGDLSGFPLIIVVIVVIIALIYAGQIAIARAMMKRARWAYWIIAVLTALQLGSSLLSALGTAAMIREVLVQAEALLPLPEAAAAVTAITGVFGTIVLIDVGIRALFMLLVGLSWRDFYGPKVRFVSEVRGNTDYELFNTGLALQRKGMWWMAMKQWEAAVANSPRDVDYLHALSVAYAKLAQWDQARETIAKAIRIAPDNQTLQQIQQRIEQMSAAQ
ncbi:MAG: hypothetical protein NZ699_07225 [Roseiflexus sp.]|nr:hypothetical protein [Roseiflexus sp.]MCS7288909.1 hypothetical protein [Roseiflexus sp.]MDW8146145.1 hypothetical protein [Roseiflexaceae bacterium]MDW8234256.1 hypothetical protein [Roseiflexaceae bacterium]